MPDPLSTSEYVFISSPLLTTPKARSWHNREPNRLGCQSPLPCVVLRTVRDPAQGSGGAPQIEDACNEVCLELMERIRRAQAVYARAMREHSEQLNRAWDDWEYNAPQDVHLEIATYWAEVERGLAEALSLVRECEEYFIALDRA